MRVRAEREREIFTVFTVFTVFLVFPVRYDSHRSSYSSRGIGSLVSNDVQEDEVHLCAIWLRSVEREAFYASSNFVARQEVAVV